ncbi:MAG: hypothetical protein KJN84_14580, partial [Bacteroidia bacterium]|nr:hypothetical protein [Bacteroidia bacterium]
PLHKAIMVSDKRATLETAYIAEQDSYKELLRQRPDFIVKSSLMLPKIMWLKNNKPNIFEQAKYFLSPNDYFGLRFTGEAVVDSLNAEKCFFDPGIGCYPKSLLNSLGIEEERLPKVVDIGSNVGSVTDEFKREININNSQRMDYIVTTYDAICAFYGSGGMNEGEACDVSGTVTSLRTLVRGKKELKTNAIFSQYQSEFDTSILGGSNNLGGGLIEWAKQAFYSEHVSPYELMESEAKKIERGSDGVLFLPYLMGERAPLWNDNARGVFFGLSRNHNRHHIIRAVFESTGFALKGLSDEIEKADQKIDVIRFSGGLSRIHLIGRIKADILGKEIHIVDQYETTAMGAFMIMGISSGIFSTFEDSSSVVNISEIILPQPAAHKNYLQIYELYSEIYQKLVPCFDQHKQLHSGNVYRSYEKIENM